MSYIASLLNIEFEDFSLQDSGSLKMCVIAGLTNEIAKIMILTCFLNTPSVFYWLVNK